MVLWYDMRYNMKLIALVGKKRVGKDTCANFIKEQEEGSIIYQLAEPIKHLLHKNRPKSMQWLTYNDFDGLGIDREMVLPISHQKIAEWLLRCVFDINNHQPYNDDLMISIVDVIKEKSEEVDHKWSIRLLLTTLGTDIVVNKIDKMFWCGLFLRKYIDNKHKKGYFIVPDIRQDVEIELVRGMGAKIIHLYRDTGLTSNHITERGLLTKSGEYTIINNGTLEEFKHSILEIL